MLITSKGNLNNFQEKKPKDTRVMDRAIKLTQKKLDNSGRTLTVVFKKIFMTILIITNK
jgi:hypothetical protein